MINQKIIAYLIKQYRIYLIFRSERLEFDINITLK